MEEKLVELVGAVQVASPEVWRIAMQQVQVEWYGRLAFVIGLVVIFVACIFFMLWCYRRVEDQEEEYATGFISAFLFAVVALIAIVLSVYPMLTITMNPEYAAITSLLKLVK